MSNLITSRVVALSCLSPCLRVEFGGSESSSSRAGGQQCVFRPARIKWRKRGYAGVFDGHLQLGFCLHRHRSPTDFY
jgi:hypothetical protein